MKCNLNKDNRGYFTSKLIQQPFRQWALTVARNCIAMYSFPNSFPIYHISQNASNISDRRYKISNNTFFIFEGSLNSSHSYLRTE